MLIEKFKGLVLSVGDVKMFLERAETLGYTDRTPIGHTGKGIELWIEVPQQAEVHRCDDRNCGKQFPLEDMARSYASGEWMLPSHESAQRTGFPCAGSGKKGTATR